mgnify:CR=1 FL=1
MQFFSRISRNTQSKSHMLTLTEYDWDLRNEALWDARQLACPIEKVAQTTHFQYQHA